MFKLMIIHLKYVYLLLLLLISIGLWYKKYYRRYVGILLLMNIYLQKEMYLKNQSICATEAYMLFLGLTFQNCNSKDEKWWPNRHLISGQTRNTTKLVNIHPELPPEVQLRR